MQIMAPNVQNMHGGVGGALLMGMSRCLDRPAEASPVSNRDTLDGSAAAASPRPAPTESSLRSPWAGPVPGPSRHDTESAWARLRLRLYICKLYNKVYNIEKLKWKHEKHCGYMVKSDK